VRRGACQHRRRQAFQQGERSPRHPKEADLQDEAEPGERPAPFADERTVLLGRREEELDLSGRQGRRDGLQAEVLLPPAFHRPPRPV